MPDLRLDRIGHAMRLAICRIPLDIDHMFELAKLLHKTLNSSTPPVLFDTGDPSRLVSMGLRDPQHRPMFRSDGAIVQAMQSHPWLAPYAGVLAYDRSRQTAAPAQLAAEVHDDPERVISYVLVVGVIEWGKMWEKELDRVKIGGGTPELGWVYTWKGARSDFRPYECHRPFVPFYMNHVILTAFASTLTSHQIDRISTKNFRDKNSQPRSTDRLLAESLSECTILSSETSLQQTVRIVVERSPEPADGPNGKMISPSRWAARAVRRVFYHEHPDAKQELEESYQAEIGTYDIPSMYRDVGVALDLLNLQDLSKSPMQEKKTSNSVQGPPTHPQPKRKSDGDLPRDQDKPGSSSATRRRKTR